MAREAEARTRGAIPERPAEPLRRAARALYAP